jgi:hypothetical protein
MSDRGDHRAQRIEKLAAVRAVIEIGIRDIGEQERNNQNNEKISHMSLRHGFSPVSTA